MRRSDLKIYYRLLRLYHENAFQILTVGGTSQCLSSIFLFNAVITHCGFSITNTIQPLKAGSLRCLKKSDRRENSSAKGAEYESQGRARSKAKRVAPGPTAVSEYGLKGRNIWGITPLQG